jgi:exopolyphosphatase/pppGpp-phosphohydrolase
MSRVATAAVVDLGSARAKLLIADRSDRHSLNIKRLTRETGLAGSVEQRGCIPVGSVEAVVAVVQEFMAIARQANCSEVVVLGTAAIRESVNRQYVVSTIEECCGPINVLTAEQEGLLFYEGLHVAYDLPAAFAAVDVGGGSVQVAWNAAGNAVISFPTGTFKLERSFGIAAAPRHQQLTSIEAFVKEAVSSSVLAAITRDVIVFGSNNIRDFLESAFRISAGGQLHRCHGRYSTTPAELRSLLLALADVEYDDMAPFFPANPRFMLGADKALINILAIADVVKARVIIPTNESLGSSVARILLLDHVRLDSLDIRPIALDSGRETP